MGSEFEDIYELLESVRMYRLRTKECLIPITSSTGTLIGYATADSDFPSVLWTISTKRAKETALARGTKEALYIRDLLSSHMGRKQLLDELRKGVLEYGIAREVPRLESREERQQAFRRVAKEAGSKADESFLVVPSEGPVQCYIPGL